MKMETTFDTDKGKLKLSFDREAQMAIAHVAARTSSLIGGKDPKCITREQGIPPEDNLFEALPLLEALAHTTSTVHTTTIAEMNLGFRLVCFSSMYLSGHRRQVRAFSVVIMMFACVTPVLIQTTSLPPAPEVLDARTAGQSSWKAYEVLRGSPNAHLFVIQAYHLWRELRHLRKPSKQLKFLVNSLDAESVLFRLAMKDLGKKELASGKRRGKKK